MKPIKPMGRSVNEPWWMSVLLWLGPVLWALLIGGLLAVVLIEWVAGCGESYVDASGVEHQYECLILDRFKP